MVCINGPKKIGVTGSREFQDQPLAFSKGYTYWRKGGEKIYLATTAGFVTFTKQPTTKPL